MHSIIAAAKSPFAKEIAKTLVLSATATAGTLAGFVAFGLACDGIDKLREHCSTKEDQTN